MRHKVCGERQEGGLGWERAGWGEWEIRNASRGMFESGQLFNTIASSRLIKMKAARLVRF